MKKTLAGLLLAAACTVGCTQYYAVHDPTTGKTYYTTQIDQRSSGTTMLTDARTGNQVTIQNSEVKEISKEAFEEGKAAPVTPPPAPMSSHGNMSTMTPPATAPAK